MGEEVYRAAARTEEDRPSTISLIRERVAGTRSVKNNDMDWDDTVGLHKRSLKI